MDRSISKQLSALTGYAGHVEVSTDFQLLENSTTHRTEVMAELCGVLIGYLKVRATAADPVTSISIVYGTHLLITCQTSDGYLLIQFSRAEVLENLRTSLSLIIGDRKY